MNNHLQRKSGYFKRFPLAIDAFYADLQRKQVTFMPFSLIIVSFYLYLQQKHKETLS